MASEKNLNAVFTDIANAIRGKKGTTDQIKPINMAEEITNLPSGGGETIELSVTQNGIYTPDEGTAYSKVSVSVPQIAESGTLKTLLDATKNCYYLFYKYGGTNIDGLISYSDTSSVTNMGCMFDRCSSLTAVSQFDTSQATNMNSMFAYCSALNTIPQFDSSNVTDMGSMFFFCSKLTTIPQLNTSKVTNMYSMFSNCTSLTAVPKLNTSQTSDTSRMFYYCSSLTAVPQLDTSNVTNMSYMFFNCSLLTTIPRLDASKVTDLSGVFGGCSSLKSILMHGMKVGFSISDSTQFEKSDLVTILNNLATVTSTKKLNMGTTNLAKLTDEERAIATNKGWTLQ